MRNFRYKILSLVLILLGSFVKMQAQNTSDTTALPFPFKDQDKTTPLNKGTSPLYGRNPSNIKDSLVYDPATNTYHIVKKIGNINYTYPTTMTFKEYQKYDFDQALKKYWQNRWKGDSYENSDLFNKKWQLGGPMLESVFGANTIEIHPQGSAELIFGLKISNVENPTLPTRLRSTTTFDFREKIQMNVTGKIGDRLNLGINYDTEATFDFENKMKLAYEGKEDDIIQKIEAGDVNLPLSGSLISGSQSLFGFKTELKFGHLTVTNVFSQQKGKKSEINVEGGAQVEEYEVYAADYEGNKHFFLSQYFYTHYDEFLRQINIITSPIQITKVEVWVTNKTGNFSDVRNVVAFMDLAEPDTIYNDLSVRKNVAYTKQWPADSANSLSQMKNNLLNWTSVNSQLASEGYRASIDYEKLESARKLNPNEYTINRRLGYISLNTRLNQDEVLAVAFEYTANGKVYRVGEFANNAKPDPAPLVLKLLKGTSVSPNLPRWNLMMKNIYAIGAYQLDRKDFELHVLYKNDKTGVAMNYIDVGDIKGKILLNVMGLDQLNSQNDPISGGDGVFDFIDKTTIDQSKGRIIFPVVQPFGSHLRKVINNDKLADKYVYDKLYTETQSIAKQESRKNKFVIKGKYQSSSGSEISLNALNVPKGSVTVSAGGRKLVEGSDYTVDYTLGRVKILNQGLLESGTPIKISLESQSIFSMQTKTLLGTHLDYKFSNKFNIGATMMNLSEKPLTKKVTQGDEPISNFIWGLNGNYQTEVPLLTKIVDKIPFIDTKEKSTLTVSGEFAHLIPGHPNTIGDQGYSYIDDFEGSSTKLDIKHYTAWSLASLPRDPSLFPHANDDGLSTGFNRAKIAWYVIDPILVRNQSQTPSYLKNSPEQRKFFVKEVYERDLWPKKENPNGISISIPVLNLAYYPRERGPYNYDINLEKDGHLKNPEERWGGIMRKLETNDFEEANVEYIEFWLMDPFVYEKGTGKHGNLYINLGDVSEDILRDSRKSFEEGMPTSENITNVDTTIWGRVSTQQSLVYAFDNNPSSRPYQDVGYDGLNDEDEQKFFADYLSKLERAGLTEQALTEIKKDPSADDYHYFRGTDYDEQQLSILERYKKYNDPEGNSPTSEQSTESYPTSATMVPNTEDINRDYTLNEAENYFQYRVPLFEGMNEENNDYIVDKVEDNSSDQGTVVWYQFKIPVKKPEKRVGEIYDFKSIRFIRMFLKDFKDSVILRFASFNLVRGQWRKYNGGLRDPGAFFSSQTSATNFDISAVNIEENGNKKPVNYVLPPGITREISPNEPQLRQQNEQAMVYKIENLTDGDARAAYKSVNLDIRQYKKIQMFVHAEEIEGLNLSDNDVTAFIRLGSDYTDNYYEYEIPLVLTPKGTYENDNQDDRKIVWPDQNMFDFYFSDLTEAKKQRNADNVSSVKEYYVQKGQNRITVKGNPSIADVRTVMIGIRNPKQSKNKLPDDGMPKSVEVWFNELRLAEFNEEGGWSANMRIATKLADFANVSLSGAITKPGFGSIEKKVSERNQDNIYQYDIASNFALGKFFPEKSGIRIPMYVGYTKGVTTPKYNPLQSDLTMEETIDNPFITDQEKEHIKSIAQDQITRKSLNFTNVKVQRKKGKPRIYSLSNWSATYSYSEINKSNINTEFDNESNYRGLLNYTFSPAPKPIQPFKKVGFLRSPYFRLIKDFNFYILPKQISFMTDMNKRYHERKTRILSEDDIRVKTTYEKDWRWNRKYDLRWDITKSLKLTFGAINTSRINEPDGRLDNSVDDYELKRDSIIDEIFALGTTKKYTHRFNLNYSIPINKIPFFNWINSSVRYGGDYYWDAGPRFKPDLLNPGFEKGNIGNVIRNSRNLQLTAQANMRSLYNKVGFLKKIIRKYKKKASSRKKKPEQEKVYFPKQKEPALVVKLILDKPKTIVHKLGTIDVQIEALDSAGQKIKGILKVVNKNKVIYTATEKSYKSVKIRITGSVDKKESLVKEIVERTALVLMGIKNISLSYNTRDQTILPGYNNITNIMGLQPTSLGMAPGLPFVFGHQDSTFLTRFAENDWLTKNHYQTNPFTMVHDQNLSLRSNIEPIKGLRISLTGSYRKRDDYTRYYSYDSLRTIREGSPQYTYPSSLNQGSYSISINTLSTSFEKMGENYFSPTFEEFKRNRILIAQKMANEQTSNSSTFPDGYNELSQDVLIHSFFATYTGTSIEKMQTNTHFYNYLFMFPSWRISYDGLSKTRFFKQYFRTITLNHNYQSTYSIGAYRTNPNYVDPIENIRDINNNYFSQLEIQSVNISERFSPLLSVDLTMRNSMNFKIEFKRSRNLILNLNNAQLTEVKTQEYVVGTGYRFKSVKLKLNKTKEVTSDLNLRLDLSIRDNLTIIRQLVEEAYQITAGQSIFSLKFNADYNLSKNFNVRFFFDWIKNNPRISNRFKTSNINFGVSVRFSLT